MKLSKIYQIYLELFDKHGDPEELWPQWCAKGKDNAQREIIALGAILTQRTSWHNADLALRNLKKEKFLSLEKIAALADLERLGKFIKPAGFYQTKPKRLFSFASFISREYGIMENFAKEDLGVARNKLLDVYGVGPETADTILLYALDKPTFVVDEYTRRLAKRRNLSSNLEYNNLKYLFEKNLPKNTTIFQKLHILIIVEQKGREGSLMDII